MQDRDPSLPAALALLGLAEGADRGAVIQAYRRLAKTTHPDVSDAPDARARFTALAAAYRQALARAEEPGPQPAASPTVRITVHSSREDPFPPPSATRGAGRSPGPLIGDLTLIDPPIVAGPVRVVPPSFRPASRGRTGEQPGGRSG